MPRFYPSIFPRINAAAQHPLPLRTSEEPPCVDDTVALRLRDAGGQGRCVASATGGPHTEVIIRGEPRRCWTAEQKQANAPESLALGVSPAEVTRRHGIGTGQLYIWRRALLATRHFAVTRQPNYPRARGGVPDTYRQEQAAPAALPQARPAQPVGLIGHPSRGTRASHAASPDRQS